MPTFLQIIHTLFSRFILILAIIICLPFIIVVMLLPQKYRYQSRIVFWGVRFFYWIIVRLSFVPVTYIGVDAIPEEPVIFAANHQSSIDIPLLGLVTPRGKPHVWLASAHLMTWSFLKWILPRLAVLVDTSSREKSMRSLLNLVRLVQDKNIDIMIFPEGSRFPDDVVHKFYGGFAILAKQLNRPVVPVYIAGVNKVYPPNTFWVQWHPITVVVGEPFVMQRDESIDEFKDRVHAWFVKESER